MAGITLAQAQAKLDAWMAANEAVANNQSYSIGSRSLTRADADDILKQIEFWDAKVQYLSAPRGRRRRTKYVCPQ